MKTEIITMKINKDSIKLAIGLSIFMLIVLRIILPYTFLKYKPHDYEFDPQKHIIVTEAIIQTSRNQGEDYDEFEVPEIWYSPGTNIFYSMDDPWYDDHINRFNRKLMLTDYFFGFIIVMLLMLKYHLQEDCTFLSNKESQAYFFVSSLIMIIIVSFIHLALGVPLSSGDDGRIDSEIYNNELYQKYVNTYK